MTGISKIVDDRIEKLRQEKIELDNLRQELAEREAAIELREKAAPLQAPPLQAAPPNTPSTAPQPPAPVKRGRGRPKKGEALPPTLPSQTELAKMRAALFTELAELEAAKASFLEEMRSELAALEEDYINRRIEIDTELDKYRLGRMKTLEKELEKHRRECFAALQDEQKRRPRTTKNAKQ
jgi:small-conductance mechanosensitive channel